jgi:hypothetical protein
MGDTQQAATSNLSSSTARLKGALCVPILAPLLRHRWFALALVGVGALQVGLAIANLPGWTCPIKAVLRVPCPGCGLSGAVAMLLTGEWQAALATHAFAPLFLLSFVALAAISTLPEPLRQKAIWQIAVLEQRTAISALLLWALIVYWGLRLIGLL